MYVTGIQIYETHHPGAVIAIQGRSNSGGAVGPWITLWSGLPSPDPPNFNPFGSLEGVSAARVYSPPISAPREVLLNEFKFTLNTAKVRARKAPPCRAILVRHRQAMAGRPKVVLLLGDSGRCSPLLRFSLSVSLLPSPPPPHGHTLVDAPLS